MLEVGIHLPQYGRVAGAEAIGRAARFAEERGFAGLWVSDHLVQPADQGYPSPYLFDPMITLTWAAAPGPATLTASTANAAVAAIPTRHTLSRRQPRLWCVMCRCRKPFPFPTWRTKWPSRRPKSSRL